MTPNEFIDNWVAQNPEECGWLARAAIQSYFLDENADTTEPFINIEKKPDLRDVDRVIVGAINRTSFLKQAESFVSHFPSQS